MVFIPTVLNPFIDISVNVIEPESIRLEASNRECLSTVRSLRTIAIRFFAIKIRVISPD